MSQGLENPLILRPLRDDASAGLAGGGLSDRERFAAFNADCNHPSEGATCACLLRHHPETTLDDYWVVEDTTTGEIVSSTCLLPWTCRFAGMDLRVAQLEMVLTHPAYRGRGLVRKQMDNFEQAVKSRGYDLAIIWGIPYYYRQFGYAYAVDGEVCEALPVWKIPSGGTLEIQLRSAERQDIPFLVEKYDEMVSGLDCYTQRTPAYWRYLIEAARHPVSIVEHGATGAKLGYVTTSHPPHDPNQPQIIENGLAETADCLAVLGQLKTQANQQITIYWPQQTPLVKLARSLGSQTVRGGQWLIRIPDVARFLGKMGPVFAQRLAAGWRTYTGTLIINLFRQAFRLRFEQGKLAGADSLGFVDSSMGADPGDLLIPPEAFVRLVMGYRRLEDLFDAWPDILVKPAARPLVDILFPPLSGYLSTPYHFLGDG